MEVCAVEVCVQWRCVCSGGVYSGGVCAVEVCVQWRCVQWRCVQWRCVQWRCVYSGGVCTVEVHVCTVEVCTVEVCAMEVCVQWHIKKPEFSDCTTLDTSLCTTSASLGASGRGKASHDNTETESATLHNVSAGFVPLKYHDSTSLPVTYRGTHDDVPRPSVFHFPGPHSIPLSVSFHSQVGTLLNAKLKHPHPHIRSRRLTVLQGKKQLTSHDAEEVYEAFMSAADPHQFQVGEEGLMHQ